MYVSKLRTVKRECRFRGWTRLQAHREHSLVAALSDAQGSLRWEAVVAFILFQ